MALGPPGQARRMGARKSLSQRSAAPVLLYFGPGVGPHPAFLSPSKRGVGAPGGAGERAKLPDRLCESRSTPRFRDPSALRGGWRVPGRGALARGPAPPGAPTRCQLSGTASCSLFERRDRRRSSKEQNKNYIYSYSKAVNPASDCDFGMRRENWQPAPAACGEPSLKTVTVSGDGPRLPLRFPIWIRLEARDRGRAEHAARPGGLRRALIARGPRAGTAQSSHCDALF